MRVVCPDCMSKAIISSSTILSDKVKDLYCACTNVEKCGGTFVMTVAFKHQLTPPQQTVAEMAMAIVKGMDDPAKKKFQQDMFG